MLTSPDGHSPEVDIENYVPVFHAAEALSSSSAAPPAESGGRFPPAGGIDEDPASPERKMIIPPNHSSLTHFTKISTCPVCQRATGQNTPHRRNTSKNDTGSFDHELGVTPACFGDAGHVVWGSVLRRRGSCRLGKLVSLMVQGHATTWRGCHPANDTMLAQRTRRSRCTWAGAERYHWLLATCYGDTP